MTEDAPRRSHAIVCPGHRAPRSAVSQNVYAMLGFSKIYNALYLEVLRAGWRTGEPYGVCEVLNCVNC